MDEDFKPNIFIGSSSETKSIAEQVQRELADFAVCKIWTKSFALGNSWLEELADKLSLYDYGIMIAGADDETKSRGVLKSSPRDNVIFEHGLYVGHLGRHRAFLMAESGIKIPSDLDGIRHLTFPSAQGPKRFGIFRSDPAIARQKQQEKIRECCKEIKAHIEDRRNKFDFRFLPSTSLAYGYFNNFILKAVTNLMQEKKLRLGNTCNFPKQCQKEHLAQSNQPVNIIDGLTFKTIELTILIPDNLSADMFGKVRKTREKNNWQLVKIDAGAFRPFDFYIQADKSSNGTLCLSDIPLTLNALNESIQAYLKKNYIGTSEAETLLEAREIRIFKAVLDYLICDNDDTKDVVKTELVDI